MDDLIAKLEDAEIGSRELDAEICLLLVPTEAQPNGCWSYRPSKDRMVDSVHPRPVTTSLDAALALAERKVPGMRWAVGYDGDCPCFAQMQNPIRSSEHFAHPFRLTEIGNTPALALCLAILRATGTKGLASEESQ